MADRRPPLVIALEEHYYDAELAATFDGPEGRAGRLDVACSTSASFAWPRWTRPESTFR